MIRIRPEKKLPPIKELIPQFKGLPSRPHKSRALLDELRELAKRLRTHEPQRFYSVREVALFFKIDPMVVVRAYRQLHTEGILTSLRSSMTMLAPLKQKASSEIRGVVGIPVWNWGFCHHAEWRETISQLELNLRQDGFVADLIFYDQELPNSPLFLEKLLMHRLDYLIWYKPQLSYSENLLALSDSGVRPVIINNLPEKFPLSEYRIDMLHAWSKTAQILQKEGMKKAIILTDKGNTEPVLEILRDFGIQTEITPEKIQFDYPLLIKWLKQLIPPEDHIFIPLNEYHWAEICYKYPQEIAQFLSQCRVINTQRLEIYPQSLSSQKIDMLRVNPAKMAAQIATDIALNRLPLHGTPTDLPVEYLQNVPAADFALFY